MKTASFLENIEFKEDKPSTSLMMETEFSKEIRIAFRSGQKMKEHKTAFPIVVEIIRGEIDFGVQGEILNLKSGQLISLEGNVPHDLLAKKESIVRLTLSKSDEFKRVENVAG